MKLPETSLAAPVVAWLRDMEWDVYQEVQVGDDIADIVATKGPLIYVVEVKVSLSLKLLAQAARWLRLAHYVSVALPFEIGKGRYLERSFAEKYMAENGIGRITVKDSEVDVNRIDARFRRRVDSEKIREKLHEKQKTTLGAGSKGGGYWTPFKETCQALRKFVEMHPGCSMKEAIDGIRHHYSSPASARGSLAHWIRAGKVKGLVLFDGKLRAGERAEPVQMEIT